MFGLNCNRVGTQRNVICAADSQATHTIHKASKYK